MQINYYKLEEYHEPSCINCNSARFLKDKSKTVLNIFKYSCTVVRIMRQYY